MVDLQLAIVLYGVKLVRAMVLWISLFVVEKVFQDSYVQQVLVQDGKPPNLSMVIVYAVAVEGAVMMLLLAVLWLLMARYKTSNNTFVLDGRALVLCAFDYLASASAVLSLGALLGDAAQNGRLFRYRHDGLRTIRALCNLLLGVSLVVVAVPFYALV